MILTMKKRNTLVLISLLGLLLPGCGKFQDFFTTVSGLYIKDHRNAYYKESSFYEKNDLEVYAIYSNGLMTEIDKNAVELTMSINGVASNPYVNFVSGGTYQVCVKSGAIISNAINIHVDEEMIFATSIDVTLSNLSTRTMDIETLNVTVAPMNYNVDLNIYSNTDDFVIYHGENSGEYKFYYEESGVKTLTVSALDSESHYIENSNSISVSDAASKHTINQTYKTLSTQNSPSVGDIKFLVLPIWLKDSGDYLPIDKRNNIIEDINSVFFGEASSTGWQSVASYYNYESKDKLRLTGTVSDWYSANYYISDIGDANNGQVRTDDVIQSATDWYFTNNPSDSRTNYDSDSDGYLDGVIMIYAAPDYYSSGVSGLYRSLSNLWAYCTWHSNVPSVTAPRPRAYMWASYDFMYGSNTAYSRTGAVYHKGTTNYCKLDPHTYIHETGHLFGLEDYYDYNHAYNPVGGFSMQDSNVGGHDPYSVLSLGWADPIIPTSSCRIKLSTFQESNQMIILTPSWNTYESVFDEYLILEYYSPTGLNTFDTLYKYQPANEGEYPSGATMYGVRLWHVDGRLTRNTGGSYTTNVYSNATIANSIHAFSNTSYGENMDHVSKLAKADKRYAEFNLLQLIRNNVYIDYRYSAYLSNSDLFTTGSVFGMTAYGKQFPRKAVFEDTGDIDTLNSKNYLGWSFKIESQTTNDVIIDFIKY